METSLRLIRPLSLSMVDGRWLANTLLPGKGNYQDTYLNEETGKNECLGWTQSNTRVAHK